MSKTCLHEFVFCLLISFMSLFLNQNVHMIIVKVQDSVCSFTSLTPSKISSMLYKQHTTIALYYNPIS